MGTQKTCTVIIRIVRESGIIMMCWNVTVVVTIARLVRITMVVVFIRIVKVSGRNLISVCGVVRILIVRGITRIGFKKRISI